MLIYNFVYLASRAKKKTELNSALLKFCSKKMEAPCGIELQTSILQALRFPCRAIDSLEFVRIKYFKK